MPAIAVPKDEPRLETLRDSPEISALQLLGEAGLHEVDRGGQHDPEAEADQQQAGREGDDARRGPDQGEQEPDPGHRDDEARDDQGLLRAALGESLRGERRDQDADRRRGEDDARLDRVVAADRLQEDGDGERDPHEQQPLDVLGDQPEVRCAVLEQARWTAAVPCLLARERGCRGRTRSGTRLRPPAAPPSARGCCRLGGSRTRRRTCRPPTGPLRTRRRDWSGRAGGGR